MRRILTALLASLLLVGLIAPAVGARPVAAAEAVPKVVVIVGPSGAATDRYRSEARAAAALARRYTPDVTEIYSPNATWPAVKKALQGASVVIYMGHGNGWPSKYRDSLYPPTQNGFGLNPKANGDDHAHQYFGEGRIAQSIKLAKNAVVLLNHLCYASGNSEPGVPEGTIDQARLRVDNFAAGFIKAGARAVIAEAWSSPNHMLRAVLTGDRSIESAWRRAPSRNGNAFAFRSQRSDGYVAMMDPERSTSGFTRSIVLDRDLTSGEVRAGGRGSAAAAAAPAVDPVELTPSLLSAGMEVEAPFIDSSTAVGSSLKYKFRYTVRERGALPDGIMASVRWDPIDVAAPDPASEVPPAVDVPAESTAPAASAAPEAAAAPGAESDPGSGDAGSDANQAPLPSVAPIDSTDEPAAPPDLGLVIPERLGEVVSPVKVKMAKTAMAFKVDAPTIPGRYRLTVTLHDKEGVAFDAASQTMFPSLLVRVTGELDAQIIAPARLDAARGAQETLDVWVANLGSDDWGHGAISTTLDPQGAAPARRAEVIGHWVALSADTRSTEAAAAANVTPGTLPAGLEPGAVVPASLGLAVPTEPGEYLLVVDVVTPDHGSLVANGIEPTIVRVTVTD